MRRFVTLALSLSLVLGLSAAGRLFAQDVKKVQTKEVLIEKSAAPAEPKADATPDTKEAAKKAETPAADAPLPSIPPEVEAKLEAARKAVAEAIVAAQDAGLVETSIDPPPILDILITGRATDARTLKAITKESPEAGVSPEVFGAWFTGYGKAMDGVTAEKNVRIIQPAKGLKDWYAARATFLNKYIDEARKATPATEKKDEAAPADDKKPEEKKDEAAPADDKKPEEKKTDEAPKAEDAKPADAPKTDDTPKTDDAPKTEETPKV